MQTSSILTMTEEELLNAPDVLPALQYFLYKRQFSEEFLSKTVEYYDSWVCLRTQVALSPYFCFRWLYDNKTDSADDWTDYNDIRRYFTRTQPHVTESDLQKAYTLAMHDRYGI